MHGLGRRTELSQFNRCRMLGQIALGGTWRGLMLPRLGCSCNAGMLSGGECRGRPLQLNPEMLLAHHKPYNFTAPF